MQRREEEEEMKMEEEKTALVKSNKNLNHLRNRQSLVKQQLIMLMHISTHVE